MPNLDNDLLFIVLKFLDEEKHKDTVHELERESGVFLNLKYLEELLVTGKYDQAEHYLLGFTKVDENMHSVKLFFQIRVQKYIEALKRKDQFKALHILVKDLKQFKDYNQKLYNNIAELITLDNPSDVMLCQRTLKWLDIKKLIEDNPTMKPKLTFPAIPSSRLKTLMNQSLHWQHHVCKNPRPNPDVKTLYVDHTCEPPNGIGTTAPTNNPFMGIIQKKEKFSPIATHMPFQLGVDLTAGWMVNPNPLMPHDAVAACGSTISGPRSSPQPSNGRMEYQFADSEHIMKDSRAVRGDEVMYLGYSHPYSENDLPKTVARSLAQGSNVVSMDFHPEQETVLLVGTNVGDIGIWEVGSCVKLVHMSFNVWVASNCTINAQALKESTISVNKCIWSPNGALIGVAFSKQIVQIYSYIKTSQLKQQLQIDAHTGGVNDISFMHLNKQLCVVTCGDDRTIKVWDAVTGHKQYTFEGHTEPVYCVCPKYKENSQFMLSISFDGKIKVWLFNQLGCEDHYDAPGHGCTTMIYTDDRSRLFSCGTNKEGESYLVECNESDGAIKWMYSGLQSRSSELVKFDTTKNRFLAAGDEYQIKFWDMDNANILCTTYAEGCLPARPRLRFNKEGSLLAVTTSNNGIKILANGDGLQVLHMLENRRAPPESVILKAPVLNPICAANGIGPIPVTSENLERNLSEALMTQLQNSVDSNKKGHVKQRLPNEGAYKRKNCMLSDVIDQIQCRSIRLEDDPLQKGQIARLLYTYSGCCLLALDSNATHKLWKWQSSDQNPSGKATTNFPPQLLQPPSGILMKNDTSCRDPEEVFPCIALSNNDSYLMSASGGKVSLFRMKTFQVMDKCMAPPPAATFIALNPMDNNIVAIGMEDTTIQIFNVKLKELNSKLTGHKKRITGLVFSEHLNALVSSGADAQLCVWGIKGWERQNSKSVHTQAGISSSPVADTRIQFHNDLVHLLVVQESQIAIYDASQLECVRYWKPRDALLAPISSATYSCDNRLVYASFCDGSICVFDAEVLSPCCRIAPSAFIPGTSSGNIYPLAIAAHPVKPNQFAIGLTDGGVHVIEPAESDGKWCAGLSDD